MPRAFSPLSFRDPDGQLNIIDDRVLRFLRPHSAGPLLQFLETPLAQELVATGQLISSIHRDSADIPLPTTSEGEWLEHEKIWFPSFPFEWAPEMLHRAGLLTLNIVEAMAGEGYELKDATPFNVLFSGSQPIFIDIASIQPMDPVRLTWHAYGQFVQSFLLPLLAYHLTSVRVDSIFVRNRDGLSPTEVDRLPGLWWSKAGRQFVLLPRLFESKSRVSRGTVNKKADPEAARFIRRRLYRGLRRNLDSLYPSEPRQNDVTEYSRDREAQEAEQTAVKRRVVEGWLERLRPARVLDVGANTGEYSRCAAKMGASVVAIDKVPEAVSLLWRRSFAERTNIQPLVVDLMRPTPAVGWRNAEHASFLDRARGKFDAVLFLAVIHHVVINDRVPLLDLFDLLADLTSEALIIEFVAREDANFVLVARGRDELFSNYTKEMFEAIAAQIFTIEAQEELPGGTRTLYLLRKGNE
jgi:2-polyprenyl-3-methyl-5-hydroxy-6-metoxy-1,4-benzoquinol methylase